MRVCAGGRDKHFGTETYFLGLCWNNLSTLQVLLCALTFHFIQFLSVQLMKTSGSVPISVVLECGRFICELHSSWANFPPCRWGVCAAQCHYPAPCDEVIPLSAQIPSLWTNDEINPAQSSSPPPSTICLCPSEAECTTLIKLQGRAGFIRERTSEVETCSTDVFQMIKQGEDFLFVFIVFLIVPRVNLYIHCCRLLSLYFTSFSMATYFISETVFLFPVYLFHISNFKPSSSADGIVGLWVGPSSPLLQTEISWQILNRLP